MRDRLKNGVDMLTGAAQLSLDFGHALLDVVIDAISGKEVPVAEPRVHIAPSLPQDSRHQPRTANNRSSKVA
jgi:hypothetical protein